MMTQERFDYYACHAPAIPEYFKRKGKNVDYGEAIYEMASPGERDVRWEWQETELEHEVRWRKHYAASMTAVHT